MKRRVALHQVKREREQYKKILNRYKKFDWTNRDCTYEKLPFNERNRRLKKDLKELHKKPFRSHTRGYAYNSAEFRYMKAKATIDF